MNSPLQQTPRAARLQILLIALATCALARAIPLELPERANSRIPPLFQQRLDTLREQQKEMQIRGDLRAEADTLRSIAELEYRCSLLEKAIDHFTRASEIYRRRQDEDDEAITLVEVGSIYLNRSRWLEALAFFKQAMPLWRGADRRHQAVTLGKMAEAFRGLGDMQEAVNFDEKALAIFDELDDKAEQAAVLNNIAMAIANGAHREKSLQSFSRARALYREIGDAKGEVITMINIAVVYNLLAKQSEALATLKQALQLSADLGYRAQQAEAASKIGAIYASLGQRAVAHDFCERAIAIYRDLGDEEGASRTRETMAFFAAQAKEGHKGRAKDENPGTESLVVQAR